MEPCSERMQINVGGLIYESTRKTLFKSPVLREMIQRMTIDDVLFVDRDGGAFSFVLNFLRNDAAVFSIDSREYIEFLMSEAAYYGVRNMEAQLQKQLTSLLHARTQQQPRLPDVGEELRSIRLLVERMVDLRKDNV